MACAASAAAAAVVAVAYSGGRDSSALLHATRAAVAGLGGVDVVALHVNHGLSRFSADWEAHCRAQCLEWRIPIACERLEDKPPPGVSVESWARERRYAALTRLARARGATAVLLAHHRRDQAETWLLQALRGAGAHGLASMPRRALRGGVTWLRPWLTVERSRIDAYVAQHGLGFVDDDSNSDSRFARNRLRLDVWPALSAAFPQAEAALTKAARWAQDAAACLDELAQIDLQALDDAGAENGATALPLHPWLQLSPARRSNVLRAWLHRITGCRPAAALIERLLLELPLAANTAAWPLGKRQLRLHQGTLVPVAEPLGQAASPPESALSIRRAGRYALPGWQGVLQAQRVTQGGVPLAWLARLELKARSGGEQFQAALGRPARSLKKQFQAAQVPSWSRNAPLFYSGGQLVFVPGLGLDVRVLACPGQPQMHLHWWSDT